MPDPVPWQHRVDKTASHWAINKCHTLSPLFSHQSLFVRTSLRALGGRVREMSQPPRSFSKDCLQQRAVAFAPTCCCRFPLAVTFSLSSTTPLLIPIPTTSATPKFHSANPYTTNSFSPVPSLSLKRLDRARILLSVLIVAWWPGRGRLGVYICLIPWLVSSRWVCSGWWPTSRGSRIVLGRVDRRDM